MSLKVQQFPVSQRQVRAWLVNRSGVGRAHGSVEEALEQMAGIQVDPIRVWYRSHEWALWNRMRGFHVEKLNRSLYTKRTAFEYWWQKYSMVPVGWWPYLRVRREVHGGWQDEFEVEHQRQLNEVRAYIKHHGPTSSLDLAHMEPKTSLGSWHNVKSNSGLLRFLWDRGEIGVHHREGNRKYFDLIGRLLPIQLLEQRVSDEECFDWLVERSLDYFGLLRIPYLDRMGYVKLEGMGQAWQRKLANGEIGRVVIPGVQTAYYARVSDIGEMELGGAKEFAGVTVFPPLDPLVIDRKRLVDVWEFEYQWEAYTPEKKRRFGYYGMPVLLGDQFVGQAELVVENREVKVRKVQVSDGINVAEVRKSVEELVGGM